MNKIHIQLIVNKLHLKTNQVEQTLSLLNEGATVPFIARYRKERTGSLDEVNISSIQKEQKRLQEIDKRRESILGAIEEQGKLTPELRKRIEASWDMTELEDLYLPYKKKRKTRASVAREKGLEPLANSLMDSASLGPVKRTGMSSISAASTIISANVRASSDLSPMTILEGFRLS